jgi:hypothetical protein
MAHSLDGAFRRVDRAREHLTDLKRRADSLRQDQEDAITFKVHPTLPDKVQAVITRLAPRHMLGILVGEVCYNLRAALDYLIFELAYLDSGQIQQGTQFPIDDKKEVFVGSTPRRLKGLSQAHIGQIEALQPYNRCDWTRTLRDISNPDKHRTLVSLQGDNTLDVVNADTQHLHLLEGVAGTVRRIHKPNGEEVYVKFRVTTALQFLDGTPILETLERVLAEVAQTIQSFESEFQ